MSFNYLNDIWEKSNHSIKLNHNYRILFPYYQGENREHNIKVDYSSNDYLSLKNDRRIIEEGYQSALRNGAGSGSSRMVTQTDPGLELLEADFSLKTGYAHSFFFPSGFIANISLFDTLSPFSWEENSFQQHIFIDHRCHSSLFYGLRNSNIKYDQCRHLDYDHLAFKLKSSYSSSKIIVIESLYSMDGDYSDPHKLLEVCQEFGAMLVIDETHSIGTFGKKACWISEYPFLKPYVLASVFGCGKAIGVSGGFISTDHFQLKERILQKSRPFIYSTAVSPFITGAVKKSLEIIFGKEGERRRDLLQENIKYLKNGIISLKPSKKEFLFHEIHFEKHNSNIFSLIYSDNLNIIEKEKFFMERGLLLKAIRPPSVPRGTSRFRVILRSGHTKEDIDFLLSYLV
jgi:7-keto-8-aminopelargonate synthetase-like enzyme